MSDVHGYISFIDTTHVSSFLGTITYGGYAEFLDTTSQYFSSGLIISDTTRVPRDTTFTQDQILSWSDMTMTFSDWTYANGHLNIDGTWVDGTFGFKLFDPTNLYYSIYYKDYDTSDFSLVGYKFREPVKINVGQYYASMIVPNTVGHYENRWTYLRDNSSYAHRIIQPFTSMSKGLDAMRDYPGDGL